MTEAAVTRPALFVDRRAAFAALLLFVFSIPWERSLPVPVFGAIGSLFGIVAMAMTAAAVFQEGRLRLRAPSLLVVVGVIFFLWSLASAFWSEYPIVALSRSASYAQLIAMMAMIWELTRSRRQHLQLMQAYVLGGFVSAAAILLEFATSSTARSFRASGLDANPNWAAIALGLAIPMAWYLFIHNSELPRKFAWLNAALVPLAIFCIALTASRGGFLVALAGALAVPLSLIRMRALLRFAILLFLALSLTGLYLWLPEGNVARLQSTSEELSQGDLSRRRLIWAAGWEVFWENPWAGVGSGGYRFAVASNYGNSAASHNAFLSILVDLGIVGLLLFTGMLVVAMIPPLFWTPPTESTLYGALGLALLVGLMPANFEVHKATWFLLALLTTRQGISLAKANLNTPRLRAHG
ncbi:MAG TPA: O-antigen ligase family protein [Trueperaceae bacterium]